MASKPDKKSDMHCPDCGESFRIAHEETYQGDPQSGFKPIKRQVLACDNCFYRTTYNTV